MKLITQRPLVTPIDTRTAHVPAKRADPFYHSPEWRTLVGNLMKARGRVCQGRGCGRRDVRLFGDHIVELQDGGAVFDGSNIQLLCGSCHTAKTAAARAARAARTFGRHG